jgi:alanine racemase
MSHPVPTLTVDLSAIVANWLLLKSLHEEKETAAVVKANAYGLGAVPVAHALYGAGCRLFFVATLDEAIALRDALPLARILVFEGLLKGSAADYRAHRLCPVLNTPEQMLRWQHETEAHAQTLPAAIHVDTAMQRLGLTLSDLQHEDTLLLARTVKADMLMTHYACASDPHHPTNHRQLEKISQAHALLPHLTTCYANSSGHFLPLQYHGAITRPGCALYGITPLEAHHPNPMQPVATLTAPILQVRTIDEDATLGYCATVHVTAGLRTVTVGMGYADGIFRAGSHALYGFIGEHRLPLLGRVTMDMVCFDASGVPESVLESATSLTLMDGRQTVDDLARIYGTIGYEVLTSMGARVRREYC